MAGWCRAGFTTLLLLLSAAASAADITLYEGDQCDEARLAHYDSRRNYADYCKRRGHVCHTNNDEARSILIRKSSNRPFFLALFDSDGDRLAPFSKVPDGSSVGYRLRIDHRFKDDVLIFVVDPRKLERDQCWPIARFDILPAGSGAVRLSGLAIDAYRRNGLAGKVSKVQIGR